MVGGGSPFVGAIGHGILHVAERDGAYPDTTLSLFDVVPELAERMARYTDLIGQSSGLPLRGKAESLREAALEGADLVFLCVPEAHNAAREAVQRFNLPEDSIHDGPPSIVVALEGFALAVEVAREMLSRCPTALLVILPNPTDVLADAVARATGVRSCGICVEVEHLRDHLAFYLGIPLDSIDLTIAGVNHDGWALDFRVDGQDGYELFDEQIRGLPSHPEFHPGMGGLVSIYEMTGRLRSSPYHSWALRPRGWGDHPSAALFTSHGQSRRGLLSALDEAIATGRPVEIPADAHPENRPWKHLGVGRPIARMARALAGGPPTVEALQARNQGAVSNLPDDVMVEVNTQVSAAGLEPLSVGDLPEWFGGTTRLQAIQRKLFADYLLDRRAGQLRQALIAVPAVASVGDLLAFANEVHEQYGRR